MANLAIALSITGSTGEAVAIVDGLIDAAEATGNPLVLSWAVCAEGLAVGDVDPVRSLAAHRRALVLARDSGNRANVSIIAGNLCRIEAEHGDPLAAFDYFSMAIGNHHDSGNSYLLRVPLGWLAAFFDRLGRYKPAAIIAGFAVTSPITALDNMADFRAAMAHLREVLGEATYEALAREGATMSIATVVAYAYDQIDEARTELERHS